LTDAGIVGPLTWGRLVAVLSNWSSTDTPPSYPGALIANGSRGNDVVTIQRNLNSISAARNPSIATVAGGTLAADGVFGARTEASVREFQRLYAIANNGIVGPITWAWLVSVHNALPVSASGVAVSAEDIQSSAIPGPATESTVSETTASENCECSARVTPPLNTTASSIPPITGQELMLMALMMMSGNNR